MKYTDVVHTLAATPRSIFNHSDDDLYFEHHPYLLGRYTRAYFSLHFLSHALGYVDDAVICQSWIAPVIMPSGPFVTQTEK